MVLSREYGNIRYGSGFGASGLLGLVRLVGLPA